MSIINRITTWTSQILTSSSLNGEFNNVVNTLNNLDGATTAWTNVKAGTLTSTGTLSVSGASTLASFSTNLFAYRRPVLQYSSGTVVNMETGLTGTSGQAQILFPDGTLRTDSTSGRINCNLAQVAALSGSAQSGLRTGTVTNNTWYAIYAVKTSDNASNFVAVADTTLPLQANYTNLNTYFGATSWVYLGLIRYGDQSGTANAILNFSQAGNFTMFKNTCTGQTDNMMGIRLAISTGGTSLTYSLSSGTGNTQIPNNITMSLWGWQSTTTAGIITTDSAAAHRYAVSVANSGANSAGQIWMPTSEGIQINSGSGANWDVNLIGFVDGALGIGSNPLL